jgi:DNA repair protein RadA/Sms
MKVPIKSTQITTLRKGTIVTGDNRFDQILGGGIPTGSAILLAGQPASGKSTLISSLAKKVSDQGYVLYVSGEESATQAKERFERLEALHENLYIYDGSLLNQIKIFSLKLKPVLLVIDSIQTLKKTEEEKLTHPKIQDNLLNLIDFIQEKQIPTIFIGHTTKEGKIAGTLSMQHFVDVVFLLQRDKRMAENVRVLQVLKNRYGVDGNSFTYLMTEKGLIPQDIEKETLSGWDWIDKTFDFGIEKMKNWQKP